MTDRLRALTMNLLTYVSADGPARQDVLRRVLVPELQPDVVALQEVTHDQAAELLGPDYAILDLPGGDPTYGGECVATRCPVVDVHKLDSAVAVEIVTPLGHILAVGHKGTYELDAEIIREQQALSTARFVEDLNQPRLPVILLGDFNAAPDSASIRFLSGRQSLNGQSVRYEDAWEARHSSDPGPTFDPRNPLVRAGQMPLERGRRIDYIMVRSGAHGPYLDVADCRRVFTEPVDGVWASDHYGLLADLQQPPHPPGEWA